MVKSNDAERDAVMIHCRRDCVGPDSLDSVGRKDEVSAMPSAIWKASGKGRGFFRIVMDDLAAGNVFSEPCPQAGIAKKWWWCRRTDTEAAHPMLLPDKRVRCIPS